MLQLVWVINLNLAEKSELTFFPGIKENGIVFNIFFFIIAGIISLICVCVSWRKMTYAETVTSKRF